MEKFDEKVWVVPRRRLLELFGGPLDRLWTGRIDAVQEVVSLAGFFMPRVEAEVDETHLQIIPYICLRRGDDIFTVERLAKQGEARLHGKLSIGIGGHLNPEDGTTSTFANGMRRELREEVGLDSPTGGRLIPMGVILDDSTPVGRVHCGVAYCLDLPSDQEVAIVETDKMAGSWWPVPMLEREVARLETWSAWLLPWLQAHRPVAHPG